MIINMRWNRCVMMHSYVTKLSIKICPILFICVLIPYADELNRSEIMLIL